MIVLGAVVAVATLAVGLLAAWLIGRLPSIRGQVVATALVSVVLPLGAVSVSGFVMFQMGADFEVLAVSAAAALAALGCALVVARAIAQRLDALGTAAETLAEGAFGTRITTTGPSEVAALSRSFNTMAESIETLFLARRDLVVAASHDLRSPLASLQAMIEATQDRVVGPDHYLEEMAIRVQVLSDLVDDLFELSALEAGALRLALEQADIGALVHRCVGGHRAEAERRGLRVHEAIDEGLPPVRCAADAMERVLANVLGNALRHTPPGGSVTLAAEASEDAVRVVVSDSGAGFTDPTRAAEPFWRADDARGVDDDGRAHAGLGLAIARGLMELQGGALHVANGPEGGARVSIFLRTA